MYFLEVSKKTLFAKLVDIYPECSHLIADCDQVYPLFCLRGACPRNANCMETLARRVKFVFDTFADAQLLLLYFAYRDRPGSIRAGVFWRSMSEPRLITFNRSGWNLMKQRGVVYEYTLPDSLFLPPRKPQEQLIVDASTLTR